MQEGVFNVRAHPLFLILSVAIFIIYNDDNYYMASYECLKTYCAIVAQSIVNKEHSSAPL